MIRGIIQVIFLEELIGLGIELMQHWVSITYYTCGAYHALQV
jgi:hypothetical protein